MVSRSPLEVRRRQCPADEGSVILELLNLLFLDQLSMINHPDAWLTLKTGYMTPSFACPMCTRPSADLDKHAVSRQISPEQVRVEVKEAW